MKAQISFDFSIYRLPLSILMITLSLAQLLPTHCPLKIPQTPYLYYTFSSPFCTCLQPAHHLRLHHVHLILLHSFIIPPGLHAVCPWGIHFSQPGSPRQRSLGTAKAKTSSSAMDSAP